MKIQALLHYTVYTACKLSRNLQYISRNLPILLRNCKVYHVFFTTPRSHQVSQHFSSASLIFSLFFPIAYIAPLFIHHCKRDVSTLKYTVNALKTCSVAAKVEPYATLCNVSDFQLQPGGGGRSGGLRAQLSLMNPVNPVVIAFSCLNTFKEKILLRRL